MFFFPSFFKATDERSSQVYQVHMAKALQEGLSIRFTWVASSVKLYCVVDLGKVENLNFCCMTSNQQPIKLHGQAQTAINQIVLSKVLNGDLLLTSCSKTHSHCQALALGWHLSQG